jgi:hypothetical protein
MSTTTPLDREVLCRRRATEVQGRIGRLFEQGLQKPGPVEEKLGTFAAQA